MPNCTQTGSHAKMRPSSVTRLNLKVYNVVEVIVLKMYLRQSTDNNLVGPCELPFNAKKKMHALIPITQEIPVKLITCLYTTKKLL